MRRAHLTHFAALLLLAVPLGACGGEEGGGEALEPITVTQTTAAPAPQETVTVVETTAAPPPQPVPEPAGTDQIIVPDVVGLDHQLAQDTMQAAGLYALAEEDATGQGRLLLWDRNWTVVSQDPPAGTNVSSDQTITLHAKKDDE
jgi:hypothetical protein